MKAYLLSVADSYDDPQQIVFANTAKEAKKLVHGEVYDELMSNHRYIDLRVKRYKHYDGMENLSPAQLAFQQWQDGWRWYDLDYPDPDTASEQEFMEWYKDTFGE